MSKWLFNKGYLPGGRNDFLAFKFIKFLLLYYVLKIILMVSV